MMRTFSRRFSSESKNAIYFDTEKLTTLPAYLEFYRPVIDTAQSMIENIQAYSGCPW